jgi:Leucine-rich repeat (LRR) protein
MSDLEQLKEIEGIIGKPLNKYKLSLIRGLGDNGYTMDDQQRLIALNLNNCQLSNIDFLLKFKFLKRLYLTSNEIHKINVIKSLKKLETLDLSFNNVEDLIPLKELKKLERLYLSDNIIIDLSPLEGLENLERLELPLNRITHLPEWVLDFNLKIKWHSQGFGICVANNPLKSPPPEIIQKGNGAIREYFEQSRQQGLDYLYEAKLILIGEGGAGKTSLANKIINPEYRLLPEIEAESTQGIDILRFQFPYKNKTFRVNIWDFGGQEIYHQTHQFFLSKRSLYFVVADNRKENTDFYYWLNIVDLLTNNSPLLIIKNEKHNRSPQIPAKQLKAQFDNIKDILATNLSDNRGLENIITALQHHISQLPHVGTALPKTWVKVREQLEQDHRYHIELKKYFEICQENGFEKEADKLQLSGYLHDLGVCLHFQDDELLCKTLILKPTWATDGVYKVLDNPQVIANFGRFNKDDLGNIWQDKKYTAMRGELLALMLNFKLCFEIPNQAKHYIAPQLLDNNAPDYTWQIQDNLLLRYQYDFMPKGLLSQFIVEMHEHIADNYRCLWKSGVILEKEQTRAEVIEYYGKREIHIRVSGQQKKELLNIVSYELDKINNSYERLKDKCKKLIPCNCSNCLPLTDPHFYDYGKLKERVAHHKYTIECGNPPYTDVEVLKLIDDKNFSKS